MCFFNYSITHSFTHASNCCSGNWIFFSYWRLVELAQQQLRRDRSLLFTHSRRLSGEFPPDWLATVCPLCSNQHIITTRYYFSQALVLPSRLLQMQEERWRFLNIGSNFFIFSHAGCLIAHLITQLDMNLTHPLRSSQQMAERVRRETWDKMKLMDFRGHLLVWIIVHTWINLLNMLKMAWSTMFKGLCLVSTPVAHATH